MADNLHLLKLAKEGDREARDRLVTDNMGLVISVARRYAGRGQELEDLIQIGLIGLMKAIDRFDMDYDVKLSTYSVPLIQGEIRRFLRDDGMVKISRNLKTVHYRAEKYIQDMQKAHGMEPTIDEICGAIGTTSEELVMAMEAAADITCIDDVHEDTLRTSESDKIVEHLYVEEMLDALTEGEKRIIKMRYFENKTQAQIGRLMGLSQVQVSRMEKKLLERLRREYGNGCDKGSA